jgi:hypothetical protein
MARVNVRDAVRLILLEKTRLSEVSAISALRCALAYLKLCGHIKIMWLRKQTRRCDVPNSVREAIHFLNSIRPSDDIESIDSDSDMELSLTAPI